MGPRDNSGAVALYGVFFFLLANWYVHALLMPFGHAAHTEAFQALALATLLMVVLVIWHAGQAWRRNRAFYLFLGYAVLSAVLISDWNHHIRYPFHVLLIFFCASALFAVEPVPRVIVNLVRRLAVVGVVAYATAVWVTLEPTPGPEVFRLTYAIRGVNNPNSISVVLLPVVAMLLLPDRSDGGWRWLFLPALFMAGWILGLCYSFAVLAGAIAAVVVLGRYRGIRTLVPFATVLFVGITAGVVNAYLLSPDDAYRPVNWSIRLEIWKQYWQLFMERPLLGSGMITEVVVVTDFVDHLGISRFNVAHNIPLHTLVQGGVIGLALFMAVAVGLAMRSMRLARSGSCYPLAYIALVIPVMMLQKGPPLNWALHSQALLLGPLLAMLACEHLRVVCDPSKDASCGS